MNKRIPICLGLLFLILFLWVLIAPTPFVSSLLDRLNNLAYDLQLKTRILNQVPLFSSPVVIVDIDDKSLKEEGHWPWPRSKIAQLVKELDDQGAAVVAFDIFFSEKDADIATRAYEKLTKFNLLTPIESSMFSSLISKHASQLDEDLALAAAIKSTAGVLAFSFVPRTESQNMLPPALKIPESIAKEKLNILTAQGYISNIPVLEAATNKGGFINIYPDPDGIIRRAPVLMKFQNQIYPSLALQSILTFLGEDVQLLTPLYGNKPRLEGIKLGSRVIPTDEFGQVLVPFLGKSYTFPYYSASHILQKRLPKNTFVGKVVFVGTSATGMGDLQATSIQSPFPGVEIQASLAYGLLKANFSYKPAWTQGALIFFTLICGLLAAFLFPYCGPKLLGTLTVLLPLTIFALNDLLWEETGLVISTLIPTILLVSTGSMNLIYGYLFETRKREQLKEMFGQYVPGKHIDEMLRMNSNYGMHGEAREMSVLFADIRNFTSISENMTAPEIVEMLNTFFTPMTEIIFNHSGTIDKYVGDLIMAFWGAPLKDELHAQHAIEAALMMQDKIRELHPFLREKGWPEIKMGIGINSGMLSVGDMGSRYRRNYTVLGDGVNLASRIEGLAKFYDAAIIVTEATAHNQPFIFRLLDKVRVKGKKNAVSIYDPICKPEKLSPELRKELARYHEALEFYFAKRWDDALLVLNDLQENYPRKKIYRIYTQRIQEFIVTPPPEDWDGVFEHASK